jgi:hypothetical protein
MCGVASVLWSKIPEKHPLHAASHEYWAPSMFCAAQIYTAHIWSCAAMWTHDMSCCVVYVVWLVFFGRKYQENSFCTPRHTNLDPLQCSALHKYAQHIYKAVQPRGLVICHVVSCYVSLWWIIQKSKNKIVAHCMHEHQNQFPNVPSCCTGLSYTWNMSGRKIRRCWEGLGPAATRTSLNTHIWTKTRYLVQGMGNGLALAFRVFMGDLYDNIA